MQIGPLRVVFRRTWRFGVTRWVDTFTGERAGWTLILGLFLVDYDG